MADSGNFYLAGAGTGALSWTQSSSTLAIVGAMTATSGYIGTAASGWDIDADEFKKGTGTSTGSSASNLNIRMSTTNDGFNGSNHTYNWAARPQGLAMTWHKDSNAGHIVMGQVMTTTAAIKSNYYGVQMMNNYGDEYFCLSANTGADNASSSADNVYNRIGGWSFDDDSIYTGTKVTSGYSANGAVSFNSNGEIHTPTFYVESDGTSAFKGTLYIGNDALDADNTLNTNTDWGDVAGTTNAPANNATNTNPPESATHSSGSVGGWTVNASSIVGSNITLNNNGTISTSQWSLNNNGSASFANGGITFAANGDITSTDFLVERSRLFGAGTDGDITIHLSGYTSDYGEGSSHVNMAPETAAEISAGHGPRLMTRNYAGVGSNIWVLLQDLYADDFYLQYKSSTAVHLRTNGYRIFVKGTLTIDSGCTITNNGSVASGQTGGAGAPGGTLSAGADGHNGGNGGDGGSNIGQAGGAGGGGGGGGGIVFISARYVSNSGTIQAAGGQGGAGASG